jgi:hypothetical protein
MAGNPGVTKWDEKRLAASLEASHRLYRARDRAAAADESAEYVSAVRLVSQELADVALAAKVANGTVTLPDADHRRLFKALPTATRNIDRAVRALESAIDLVTYEPVRPHRPTVIQPVQRQVRVRPVARRRPGRRRTRTAARSPDREDPEPPEPPAVALLAGATA